MLTDFRVCYQVGVQINALQNLNFVCFGLKSQSKTLSFLPSRICDKFCFEQGDLRT